MGKKDNPPAQLVIITAIISDHLLLTSTFEPSSGGWCMTPLYVTKASALHIHS